MLSTVGLIECLFVFVSTYKPIAMITEPSQFSLIPRVLPSYSVAYVTVQLKRWGGSTLGMRQLKSVTYIMTATIMC